MNGVLKMKEKNQFFEPLEEVLEDSIELNKLAGVYREIARRFGYDVAVKMHNHFHGQQVSFPMRFLDSEYVASLIVEEYENGANIRELSVKYDYTERRIRQIISKL